MELKAILKQIGFLLKWVPEQADGEGEGRYEEVDDGQQDEADELDVGPQHHGPVVDKNMKFWIWKISSQISICLSHACL